MERTMSVEERIRRAEEIYNRRNQDSYYAYGMGTREKKKSSLKSRLIKQIIICLMVYGLFYVVTNREYFLSQEFQEKVKDIASKNEYLNKTYNYIIENLNKYLNIEEHTQEKSSKENEIEQENRIEEQNIESIQMEENNSQSKEGSNDENIGGAEEIGNEEKEESQEKTQEDQDIEEIKNTTSFIVPIQGTISSTFGWRTPTTKTVPKYHTGLDIAAKFGTVIKSATDGKVVLASSQGDYGNHYKIQINDIIIIYAHCSKLYLKEGAEVKQGQEIAEVGSTGNSTGPHLHFEIRKGERLVNPELILDI